MCSSTSPLLSWSRILSPTYYIPPLPPTLEIFPFRCRTPDSNPWSPVYSTNRPPNKQSPTRTPTATLLAPRQKSCMDRVTAIKRRALCTRTQLISSNQSCPRVGWTRVSGRVGITILPDFGGSGRVGSALWIFYFLLIIFLVPKSTRIFEYYIRIDWFSTSFKI